MIKLIYFSLISVILSGCGTAGTVERSFVEDITPSEDISSIVEVKNSESTSGKAHSKIFRVDGEPPENISSMKAQIAGDLRDRYKIYISPGRHSITVSCWRGWLGFGKFFTLEFNAAKSRDYAAKCEYIDYGGIFSCKADWWVEIFDLGSDEVVMKSEVTRSNEC